MNKNRIFGGLVAGLIFAGALTACGSDSDSGSGDDTTETTKAAEGEKTTETTAKAEETTTTKK